MLPFYICYFFQNMRVTINRVMTLIMNGAIIDGSIVITYQIINPIRKRSHD